MSLSMRSPASRKRQGPGTRAAVGGYRFVDDRLNSANFLRRSINKIFPDHWSFMLGEIALYSFIILLLSGVFLTMFFVPSDQEVIYNGQYPPLHGVTMSEAYASTLRISFDVRGGLLIRQIHHWAALLFVAAMVVHCCRIFFTGAFRKPREVNWLIGVGLLTLGVFEGFAGYSLPDDLFSGTGLRIGYSVLESVPVVGSWLAFFIWGGEFPGIGFFHRLYAVHILLIPGLLLALISAHMMILWHQKHTQFPGAGQTEDNVVGTRMWPGYAAKGGAYFFLVFAVCAFLAGLVEINPIWYWGEYQPAMVSTFVQPDWYMGFLEGSLRIMPGAEWRIFGATIPFNILIPAVVVPGLMFTLLGLYPWIEKKFITKDDDYHNLLDRPRDNPTRTAIGMMALTEYLVLFFAGGNDIIATTFNISLNATTWTFRTLFIFAPPAAFWATRRVCLGLLRKEEEEMHHGVETGTIKRLPHGEYIEVTLPPSPSHKLVLEAMEEARERTKQTAPALGSMAGARSKLSNFFYTRQDPRQPDERRTPR